MITQEIITQFKEHIWEFYRLNRRSFAWRNSDDPYEIVISEVMLQQTQTYRVEPKYAAFVAELPTFEALANASLHTVLSLWQGLGYNRRGRFLHELAKQVVHNHKGVFPSTPDELVHLPGIGKATAASICAFAFNKPTIFIETNIRTVYIQAFFPQRTDVHDKELMPLIEATVDQANPREWYYALMDYGVYLKKQLPNPSRKSKHHTTQSKFEGSDRQIRGAIIRQLVKQQNVSHHELIMCTKKDPERVSTIIEQLVAEKLIRCVDNQYIIT